MVARFFRKLRTLHERRIEDGLINTVLLVEVDDPLAVNWTEPKEYDFDAHHPRRGLGGLRGGQVFLAWGGGLVGTVSMQSPAEAFKAIFTADGGEPFTMASLNRQIDYSMVSAQAPAAALESASAEDTDVSASGTRSRAPAASHPVEPASELASNFLSAASAALGQNDPASAWQWYYGALLTGAASRPEYEWYPALRRPAFGVHFAIGVVSESSAAVRDIRRRDGQAVSRGDMEKASAPYGEALMSIVEKHAKEVSVAKHLGFAEDAKRRRRSGGFQAAATITLLHPGSVAQLRSEAMEAGGDVLVLLEVDSNRDVPIARCV